MEFVFSELMVNFLIRHGPQLSTGTFQHLIIYVQINKYQQINTFIKCNYVLSDIQT
jgi:hypothetical protein